MIHLLNFSMKQHGISSNNVHVFSLCLTKMKCKFIAPKTNDNGTGPVHENGLHTCGGRSLMAEWLRGQRLRNT